MERKIVETCELNVYVVDELKLIHKFSPFHKRLWQWQAHAISSKGTYIAAWSATFEASDGGYPQSATGGVSEASDQAHKEVVSIMLHEGWIPMNDRYYKQAYTREVKSE